MIDPSSVAAPTAVGAAASVWSSKKFRMSLYGGLLSIASAFVTGYATTYYPKLSPELVAGLMEHVAAGTLAPFLLSIVGHAWTDAKLSRPLSAP